MSHKAALYFNNKSIDFRKFNDHFRMSLVKELDFKQEVVNLERTRNNFKHYKGMYLPKTYVMKSSSRVIVMEFCRGLRIDDMEQLEEKYGKNGA